MPAATTQQHVRRARRVIAWGCAVLVGWCGPAAALSHPAVAHPTADELASGAFIGLRVVPDEYARIDEFLEFIKFDDKDVSGGFLPGRTPRVDVEKYLSFLSAQGVDFSDINREGSDVDLAVRPTWHQSPVALRKDLSRRHGRAFLMLAHMAFIYSIPFHQYSDLKFSPTPRGVQVKLVGGYILTFVKEQGRFQLARCDYDVLQDP